MRDSHGGLGVLQHKSGGGLGCLKPTCTPSLTKGPPKEGPSAWAGVILSFSSSISMSNPLGLGVSSRPVGRPPGEMAVMAAPPGWVPAERASLWRGGYALGALSHSCQPPAG